MGLVVVIPAVKLGDGKLLPGTLILNPPAVPNNPVFIPVPPNSELLSDDVKLNLFILRLWPGTYPLSPNPLWLLSSFKLYPKLLSPKSVGLLCAKLPETPVYNLLVSILLPIPLLPNPPLLIPLKGVVGKLNGIGFCVK